MTKKIKDNIWCYLATVYPLGKAPFAPGTFGSLAGIPLAYLCKAIFDDSLLLWSGFLICFGLVAWFVIKKAEEYWQTHDDKSIVIDEVVGQLIALAPTTLAPGEILIAFVGFRILDIWKPGPIGWCDAHLQSPFGTLIDDVLCGLLVVLGFTLFNL